MVPEKQPGSAISMATINSAMEHWASRALTIYRSCIAWNAYAAVSSMGQMVVTYMNVNARSVSEGQKVSGTGVTFYLTVILSNLVSEHLRNRVGVN